MTVTETTPTPTTVEELREKIRAIVCEMAARQSWCSDVNGRLGRLGVQPLNQATLILTGLVEGVTPVGRAILADEQARADVFDRIRHPESVAIAADGTVTLTLRGTWTTAHTAGPLPASATASADRYWAQFVDELFPPKFKDDLTIRRTGGTADSVIAVPQTGTPLSGTDDAAGLLGVVVHELRRGMDDGHVSSERANEALEQLGLSPLRRLRIRSWEARLVATDAVGRVILADPDARAAAARHLDGTVNGDEIRASRDDVYRRRDLWGVTPAGQLDLVPVDLVMVSREFCPPTPWPGLEWQIISATAAS